MMVGADRVMGMRVTPFRRFAFFLTGDVVLVVASLALAVALRFDGAPPAGVYALLPPVLIVGVVSVLATLLVLGVYRLSWAFMGLRDIARLAVAVVAATVTLGLFIQVMQGLELTTLPRSVALIQAPITFCLLAGFRLSKRAYRAATGRGSVPRVPTILVGAGDAGAQVLRSIQATQAPYRVVGFVDDDRLARGTAILGSPVLGPVSELGNVIERHGAKAVILTVASASAPFVQSVVRAAREAGVQTIRTVPAFSQLVNGEVSIESTRAVSLEDLLGREAIAVNDEEVTGLLAERRVVVTGGAGTIGAELCRQIARFGPSRLTILDVDETRIHDTAVDLEHAFPELDVCQALVDVRDSKAVTDLFRQEKPEIVFHAAAYKHVPMMERFPLAALHVNVIGTANVLDACEATGVKRFIMISTDKAVEPSSVMGASKRLAELAVFGNGPSRRGRTRTGMIRSAVRFGNVIGSRGSVIPTFERQLKQGGPLTVTHPEMERFFMMTSEAVSLVLQAAALGRGGDLFVLDMGKPVRIMEVAREFIRLSGLEPDRDVRVAITGLRPGEKLRERLNYPEEELVATRHARVLRAVLGTPPQEDDVVGWVRGLLDRGVPSEALEVLMDRFPTLQATREAYGAHHPEPRPQPPPDGEAKRTLPIVTKKA